MRGRRVRITYVTMAAVAFALSLIAGDAAFIALTGAALVTSLIGAFIATRQEGQGS